MIEDEIDADALQDLSVSVQETVDASAIDAIHGCATGGSFSPPVIELDVDILAGSQAELYEVVARIMATIEQHCPIRFVAGDTHIERADSRELVPA